MNRQKSSLVFCLFVVIAFPSLAFPFTVINNSLDLSYENVALPEREILGLSGANYLIHTDTGFNYGLGLYGAVRGKRGGFFTGGAQIQYQKTLYKSFFLGAESFFGGGGGGAAPQGGGLMLRAAVLSGISAGTHDFKISYSYISFPNGDINSNQLALGYAYRFKTLMLPGWGVSTASSDSIVNDQKLRSVPHNFALQTNMYFPNKNAQRVSGKDLNQRLDVVGIKYQTLLRDKLWFDFETGGALGGGIDGFAQIFAGIVYKMPLFSKHFWSSGILLGSAGGGDVYTGGGSVFKAYSGIDFHLLNNWYLFNHAGLISAPGGQFEAVTLNIGIARYYKGLKLTESSLPDTATTKLSSRKFRIRPGIQNYSFYQNHSRKSSGLKNHQISSVQLKLDSFITNRMYFTGHAIGAFDGGAGGYAVGLLGMGYQIWSYFNLELLVGAAGGGGVDVGDGKVIEPSANVEIPINKAWSIEPGIGYIQALDGNLSSWVSSIGLSYRFLVPGVE